MPNSVVSSVYLDAYTYVVVLPSDAEILTLVGEQLFYLSRDSTVGSTPWEVRSTLSNVYIDLDPAMKYVGMLQRGPMSHFIFMRKQC